MVKQSFVGHDRPRGLSGDFFPPFRGTICRVGSRRQKTPPGDVSIPANIVCFQGDGLLTEIETAPFLKIGLQTPQGHLICFYRIQKYP